MASTKAYPKLQVNFIPREIIQVPCAIKSSCNSNRKIKFLDIQNLDFQLAGLSIGVQI